MMWMTYKILNWFIHFNEDSISLYPSSSHFMFYQYNQSYFFTKHLWLPTSSNLLPHLFLAISQFFCLCNLVLLQNAFLQQGSLKLTFSLKLLKNGRGVVYAMCSTMFSNTPHIYKNLLRRMTIKSLPMQGYS